MPREVGWDSPGVRTKPQHCRLCPLAAIGQGFCEDDAPTKPLVAFVLDMPTAADVRERAPFSGAEGRAWTEQFITHAGYTRQDVLFSTCLRCRQANDKFGQAVYPRGPNRRLAEINCRHYDTKLLAYDPNLFIVTVHPRGIRLVNCYLRQIQRDVAKAFRFAIQGYRPAVLFGEGVVELYYPWIKNSGGLKNWRGHWWAGESPFKDGPPPAERLYGD